MNAVDVLLAKNLSGGGNVAEELSVTANGTYIAEAGKAYNPVIVDVPSDGGNVFAETLVGNPKEWTLAKSTTKIIIPSEAKIVGQNCCANYKNLEEVVILGESITVYRDAFSGCSKLKSIDFAKTNSIGQSAFYNCVMIEEVKFTQISNLSPAAFSGCSGLKSVDLPADIASMGNGVFSNCTSLRTFICRAVTPPTITSSTFANVPADCNIFVPAGSVEAYKTEQYWSDRADYIQAIQE